MQNLEMKQAQDRGFEECFSVFKKWWLVHISVIFHLNTS